MNTTVNIYEAKAKLSSLIAQAMEGKEVIISKAGKPVAKLTAYTSPLKKRQWGFLKGKIWMAEDFDETSKEIIDLFYESEIEPTP